MVDFLWIAKQIYYIIFLERYQQNEQFLNLFSFFTRFPVWFVVESEIEKGGMRDAKSISEKRA